MAYIEERIQTIQPGNKKKKVYRARIRIKGMPEESETFHSKAKAKAWAVKMEAKMREQRCFPKKEDLERTFSELVDRYIQFELPKKPKSFDKQKKQLLWWKSHLGPYYLRLLTSSLIAEVRDKLLVGHSRRGKVRSNSTVNRYLAALSHAFTIAVKEWGWCEENPVLKVRKLKEGKARDVYLEKEEISRLLDACKNSKSRHLYSVVVLALTTCARKSELLSLKWSDIDFSRKRMTFRDTKNGEIRSVFLSSHSLECLLKQRDRSFSNCDYVFPSLDGSKPADIRNAWENALKEACLDKKKSGLKIWFHTLRHTGASHLAMNGVTDLEIAAVLGHKSLSMVKRYSHLSTSSTARIVDRMNISIMEKSTNE